MMNALLQRYKLPVDKQTIYTFLFSKQGGYLFDQSQFVQEDQADCYGSDVFYKKRIRIEEVKGDCSFIRQFFFQYFSFDA